MESIRSTAPSSSESLRDRKDQSLQASKALLTITARASFYCLDKLTEPKPGPEHETRPDTAVSRLDVTTTLIRV